MDNPRLTHIVICTFVQLSKVCLTMEEWVNFYFQLRMTRKYLFRTMVETKYHELPLGRFAWPGVPGSWYNISPLDEEPDVITQIIQADCPPCFEWIRKWAPRVAATGFNEHNWSFISLAVHSKSILILRHFFRQDPECIELLIQRANPGFGAYAPMGYLALTLDVRFVEQVFEMLKPHLHELKVKLKSREHIVFPPIIKYSFCKFVTSAIAEQFKELGVLIYDFGECPSQGNPYHAAASNNAAFLDYLWRNLDIPPYAPNRHGDSPLTIAQRGHNAEAIRWFRLKRLLQVATLRQIKPAPRIYIAI